MNEGIVVIGTCFWAKARTWKLLFNQLEWIFLYEALKLFTFWSFKVLFKIILLKIFAKLKV